MSNELAIIQNVQNHIAKLMEKGSIDLPAGYSSGNALSEAYLILKETLDRNKRPVLEVCTPESIDLALLNMVVMGFYPSRQHCYFIAYGKKLTLMPSYLGKVMVAKRLNPNLGEIAAEIVYDGDVLEVEIKNGRKTIVFHKQQFKAPTIDVIAGAYAMAVDRNGEVFQTEIMSKAEILQSWKQSKQKPFDDKGELRKGTVHQKFAGEMAKRTVKNRLCKTLVSSAVEPSSYIDNAMQEIEVEAVEAELENAIAESAGVIKIGFPNQEVVPEKPEKPAPKRRSPRKKKAEEAKPPIPEAEMEIDDDKIEVLHGESPFGDEDLPNPDDIPNQPEGEDFDPGF